MSREFEKHVNVDDCTVFPNVKIGYRSYANSSVIRNGTSIGRYCSIGRRCTLSAALHPTHWLSTHPRFSDTRNNAADLPAWSRYRPLDIGNDVWIGDNVIILNGLTIGDGAVIGAGSIVTKDVPPYAIYAGVPARLLRYRFEPQVIADLLEIRWWDYEEEILMDIAWNDIEQAINLIRDRIESGRYKLMPRHVVNEPEKPFRMAL